MLFALLRLTQSFVSSLASALVRRFYANWSCGKQLQYGDVLCPRKLANSAANGQPLLEGWGGHSEKVKSPDILTRTTQPQPHHSSCLISSELPVPVPVLCR